MSQTLELEATINQMPTSTTVLDSVECVSTPHVAVDTAAVRPKLSADEKARIRYRAVLRVMNGESAATVTRSMGLGPKTIFKWMKIAREKGLEALAPIPRSGRNRNLSSEHEALISCWLMCHQPSEFGFDSPLWSREIVRELVRTKLQIVLSVSTVHRLLHRIQVAPQKSIDGNGANCTAAESAWLEGDYPAIRGLAKKRGAQIFWLCENLDVPNAVWRETQGTEADTRFVSIMSNRGYFRYAAIPRQNFDAELLQFLTTFLRGYDGSILLMGASFLREESPITKLLCQRYPGRLQLFNTPIAEPASERVA